jgi:alpha,alpha-trehalose phosphorylase
MRSCPKVAPDRYDAVLFDLDGVLTSTTALHAACWKQTLDELLAVWGQQPFDIERDYAQYVDGKPRADGVRDFLRSRGALLPEHCVRAIGDRKQALVERALALDGVEAFTGSIRWVEQLREASTPTAVVSSSVNTGAVLRAAGISRLFDVTVDGHDIERLGLHGKPAPDGFVEAARRLDVRPGRAVVVEDALAGVAAGRAGRFGLVIAVARNVPRADLLAAGADVVVDDLAELVA